VYLKVLRARLKRVMKLRARPVEVKGGGDGSDDEYKYEDEDEGEHEGGDPVKSYKPEVEVAKESYESEVELTKGLIELVESWPTRFYDLGRRLPFLCFVLGPDADKLQDKLQDLTKKLSPNVRRLGGKDLLLRFLAENTKDRKASKTSSETFTDIMNRYLYSPGPAEHWNHLIGSNRILSTVCKRQTTWGVATTAVLISPVIHNSWVVRADHLNRVSFSPSSQVVSFFTRPPWYLRLSQRG
jgi:hypothetical protein